MSESKMGRPRLDVLETEEQWAQFEQFALAQCTLAEISAFLNCSEDTVENRVKERHGVTFSDYYKRCSGTASASLRRVMWHKAMVEGNVTMMIFLSKQRHLMGYSDRHGAEEGTYERLMGLCKDLEARKAKQTNP